MRLYYIFPMKNRNQANALYGSNKIKRDRKLIVEIIFDFDPKPISANENIHTVFKNSFELGF